MKDPLTAVDIDSIRAFADTAERHRGDYFAGTGHIDLDARHVVALLDAWEEAASLREEVWRREAREAEVATLLRQICAHVAQEERRTESDQTADALFEIERAAEAALAALVMAGTPDQEKEPK